MSTATLRKERGIVRLAGAGFASLVAFAMILFAAPAASANPRRWDLGLLAVEFDDARVDSRTEVGERR